MSGDRGFPAGSSGAWGEMDVGLRMPSDLARWSGAGARKLPRPSREPARGRGAGPGPGEAVVPGGCGKLKDPARPRGAPSGDRLPGVRKKGLAPGSGAGGRCRMLRGRRRKPSRDDPRPPSRKRGGDARVPLGSPGSAPETERPSFARPRPRAVGRAE